MSPKEPTGGRKPTGSGEPTAPPGAWSGTDPAAYEDFGWRALLILRVISIGAVVIFFGAASVNSGFRREVLPPQLWVWSVLAVAALTALLVCRRPARRVPMLSYTIAVTTATSVFVSLISLFAGYQPTVLPALVCGPLALVLLYRGQRAGGGQGAGT